MTDPDPAALPASIPPNVPVPNAAQPTAGSPIDKSVGAALVLTFFFGPLGLFYINVRGAVIAIIVSLIVGLLTLGFGLLFVWPITMVWAAVTASKKHQKFEEWKIGKLAGGANYGAA
ncbi:MAG: hypothetical protein WBV74_15350 [Pseudonocardiaceae bacterium]